MSRAQPGRRTKPKLEPQCRDCGRGKREHGKAWTEYYGSTACARYRPPKREPRRSSTVKYSKAAELLVAKKLNGRRLPSGEWQGPGDVDVECRGPDGVVYLVVQVKQYGGTTSKAQMIKEGFAQVLPAAMSLRPRPLPAVATVDKPGPGTPVNIELHFKIDDYAEWNVPLGEAE